MFQASQEVWDETQEKMAQFVYIPTPSAVPSSYTSLFYFTSLCTERPRCTPTGAASEVANRSTKEIASQTRPVAVVADSNAANKSHDRFLQDIFAIGAEKKVRTCGIRPFLLPTSIVQVTGFTTVLPTTTETGITDLV